MKKWTHLVVDVDYSPSDPGICNWFCERTEIPYEDVKEGAFVRYEDPSGILASIKVVEKTPKKLVLESAGRTATLQEDHTTAKLDEGGRNYTNFLLHAWVKFEE